MSQRPGLGEVGLYLDELRVGGLEQLFVALVPLAPLGHEEE